MVFYFVEAEVAANFEPPKPYNRVTNLDNPSEIVNQVQKELVFNNSSNKEDRPKGIEQKAKGRQWALSIQQKSPVQIFGIFASQMERVRPLPRIRSHMLCNTRNAG